MNPAQMEAVILCGGQGTRLREETEFKPKPMVEIGGKPLLLHLMSYYAAHGHKDFVLCLGYLGDVIKRYFLDFAALSSDFTVDLSDQHRVELHSKAHRDWRVTCVDTGANAMTGARLARVARYLHADDFLLTYGDGLSNVDLGGLVKFHRSHGKLATVTGVHPPGRFGELAIDGERVRSFVEKPAGAGEDLINGGFFVFKRRFLDLVTPDDSCMLEREPLERAARDGELMVHRHDGYWQCMDTYRDLMSLEQAWQAGRAPWRNW